MTGLDQWRHVVLAGVIPSEHAADRTNVANDAAKLRDREAIAHRRLLQLGERALVDRNQGDVRQMKHQNAASPWQTWRRKWRVIIWKTPYE